MDFYGLSVHLFLRNSNTVKSSLVLLFSVRLIFWPPRYCLHPAVLQPLCSVATSPRQWDTGRLPGRATRLTQLCKALASWVGVVDSHPSSLSGASRGILCVTMDFQCYVCVFLMFILGNVYMYSQS